MTLLTPSLLEAKTYPFGRLRQMYADVNAGQAGVMDPTHFVATQRAAGANMTVDVSAGRAWVPGSDSVLQGSYHVINDALVTSAVTFTAAHATLPRIDQLWLRVRDSTYSVAGDDAVFVVTTGTPTAGAQASNPLGANYRAGANPTAPTSAIRLYDVLVPAAAGSIVNANLYDRRLMALGKRVAANGAGGSTGGAFALLDPTNMYPQIECSGRPIRMALAATVGNSTPGGGIQLQPWMDGAVVVGAPTQSYCLYGNNEVQIAYCEHIFTPTAGPHKFGWAGVNAFTGTGNYSAIRQTVEELMYGV